LTGLSYHLKNNYTNIVQNERRKGLLFCIYHLNQKNPSGWTWAPRLKIVAILPDDWKKTKWLGKASVSSRTGFHLPEFSAIEIFSPSSEQTIAFCFGIVDCVQNSETFYRPGRFVKVSRLSDARNHAIKNFGRNWPRLSWSLGNYVEKSFSAQFHRRRHLTLLRQAWRHMSGIDFLDWNQYSTECVYFDSFP
jgi:hypothetical protein